MSWAWAVLVYCGIGVFLLEKAWSATSKLRAVDHERDQKYPAFSRTDIYKLQKWKLYPAALTVLPARAVLHALSYVLLFCVQRLIMWGWDRKGNQEMSPFKRIYGGAAIAISATFNLFMSLIFVSVEHKSFDYTKWLGKNYESLPEKRCGMFISNHVGFFDPEVILSAFWGQTAFVIADWVEKIPVYGDFCHEVES